MDMNSVPPPVMPIDAIQPDPNRPKFVSVLDPIEPAIAHVRQMLFRPFDLGKWMIIGFCAWLAYLGRSGGGGFNYNFPNRHHPFGAGGPEIAEIKATILPYLPLIIIGVISLVVFFFILGLVLAWLRSRGQFMFVHCIATNKAEIGAPWYKYSRHGNSVFLFKVVLSIIGLFVFALPIGILIISIFSLSAGSFIPAGVMGIIGAALGLFIVCIALGLIVKFTDDFVVPIMFTQTASVMAGWKKFLAILSRNKGRILLYILFQIVIAIVISIISTMICLIGCCCCCSSILLLIPYIGTVILLPLVAFKRSYSLFYLRQFGPQFDVFIASPLAAI